MENDEVMKRYKSPRFRAALDSLGSETAGAGIVFASGENMLCGDSLSVAFLMQTLADGSEVVERGCYEGYGCTLCIASAEVVMEAVRGLSVADCLAITEDDIAVALGGIEVGRSRKKCVRLPLEAMRRALL